MYRKRKQRTPFLGGPAHHNPLTSEVAQVQFLGEYPYCAMMQVAADDTHANYVICRGYDARQKKFVDYESGNSNKPGIAVGKPFGRRVTGLYFVGQIYPAFLPLWKIGVPGWGIGQNPGVIESGGADGVGHAKNLTYGLEILKDDGNKPINWMLIDAAATMLVELCLAEDHPGLAGTSTDPFDAYLGIWDPAADDWEYDSCVRTVKAIDHRYGVPYPAEGATGLFTPRPSDTYGTIYECVSLDCSSAGVCCP